MMTTITTEEVKRLADGVEDAHSLFVTADALRSLAAERDALRAEVERRGTVCDNYFRQVSLMQMRHARHLLLLETRIARQRRALAKLYQRRHDKKAEVERLESGVSYETFVSGMQIVTTERDALRAENARLREALRLAIEAVEFWAAYATSYFQEKHDLAGDLQKLRAELGEKE